MIARVGVKLKGCFEKGLVEDGGRLAPHQRQLNIMLCVP